jgi:hypothetical protein
MTTNRPMVILLSGWAGSGKDCTATLLTEEFGFRRLAFADALKSDVSRVTGLQLDCFYTSQKDRPLAIVCSVYPSAKTPRDVLIQHALVRRAEDPDIYSRGIATDILKTTEKRAGEEVHNFLHMGKFVITDWRYLREHEVIAEELGKLYQIVRVRIDRPSITQSADPSEHDLDGLAMDYVIHNDGSISDLRRSVKHIFQLAAPKVITQSAFNTR